MGYAAAMDEPANIKRFNSVVAHAFAELYAAFPEKTKVSAYHIAIAALYSDAPVRPSTDDEAFVKSALSWLEKAEYVWVIKDYGVTTQVTGAVLSEKGLAALKRDHAIPGTRVETFSAGFIRAVRENSSDFSAKLVTEFFLAAPRVAGAFA